MRRHEGTVYDSNRWDGLELRLGDIIIASPPKCGTTWTKMKTETVNPRPPTE